MTLGPNDDKALRVRRNRSPSGRERDGPIAMLTNRRSANLAGILAAALGLLAPHGLAAQDVKDSRDHPRFARIKGYYIGAYLEKRSDDAAFCVRVEKAHTKVQGHYWRLDYRRTRSGRSLTGDQVRNHYRALLKKAHADPVCESPPDLDARVLRDGIETWFHLRAFAPGDSYEIEIVEREVR
jgi:hypothetical protein